MYFQINLDAFTILEHQLSSSGGEGSDAVRKTSSKAEEESAIHISREVQPATPVVSSWQLGFFPSFISVYHGYGDMYSLYTVLR